MREQFPFLYEADCPREYKELYAQKKIALDNYIVNHNRLMATFYDEEGNLRENAKPDFEWTFKTAKEALDSFNENQLIYDEFNYYQETKKVLGIHPVFRVLKLTDGITKMRDVTAVKRVRNLNNYINRTRRNLEKVADKETKMAQEEKIKLWIEERDLINTLKKLDG